MLVFPVLCTLDAGLTFGSMLVLWSAEAAGYQAPPYVEMDLSSTEEWLFAVGLAPVLEEAIFRGWLSGSRAALNFARRGGMVVAVLALVTIAYENGMLLKTAPVIQLGRWLMPSRMHWRSGCASETSKRRYPPGSRPTTPTWCGVARSLSERSTC